MAGKATQFQCLYVVAGVFATMIMQHIQYQGGAEAVTLLPTLFTYVGMTLVFIIPETQSSKVPPRYWPSGPVAVGAFLGVIGNGTTFAGLAWAGSGLYQVVYSSVIICAAVFSRIFLSKHLSSQQWCFVVLVTVGLITSQLGPAESELELLATNTETDVVVASPAGVTPRLSRMAVLTQLVVDNAFRGFLMTLLSAVVFALQYTYFEALFRREKAADAVVSASNSHDLLLVQLSPHATTDNEAQIPPKPVDAPLSSKEMCVQTGLSSVMLVSIYMVLYTVPRWDALVTTNIQAADGDASSVAWLYALFIAVNLLLNWSYFGVIMSAGAVAAGICQAVRAVLVFVASHVLYCSSHSEQCFTIHKGVGLVMVVGGVMGYVSQISPEMGTKSRE